MWGVSIKRKSPSRWCLGNKMRNYFSIVSLFLLPLIFLTPTLSVDRMAETPGLLVKLDFQDEHVARCIESGLEVRYRLEYQVCRMRGSWFDACAEKKLVARSVQYDPVSESYRIKTDSLADVEPAIVTMEMDTDTALSKLSQFVLPDGRELTSQTQYSYLSVRVRGYCQREEQSLLTQIPYYLTLGIFRFTGFDTGWIDFNLR